MTDKVQRKYITAAEADRIRRQALALFTPCTLDSFDRMRHGSQPWIDYYIVPDDDPRVGTTSESTIEDL